MGDGDDATESAEEEEACKEVESTNIDSCALDDDEPAPEMKPDTMVNRLQHVDSNRIQLSLVMVIVLAYALIVCLFCL